MGYLDNSIVTVDAILTKKVESYLQKEMVLLKLLNSLYQMMK